MPYLPLSLWSVIAFTGADRQKFLHNFCTNQVRNLEPVQGCEAFFTDVKGRTLGHGWLLAEAERLLLLTVPGQAEILIPHFDRYLIREDVTIADLTEPTAVVLLVGGEASVGNDLSARPWSHTMTHFGPVAVQLVRIDWLAEPACVALLSASELTAFEATLTERGAKRWSEAEFEFARLEHGTPFFGPDITPTNLPQELQRDTQAISFTKGCYLGQETVARIDALGQVNQLLVRVAIPNGGVRAGQELKSAEQEKPVGQVTSVATAGEGQIGLAMVRRAAAATGTKLLAGTMTVVVR